MSNNRVSIQLLIKVSSYTGGILRLKALRRVRIVDSERGVVEDAPPNNATKSERKSEKQILKAFRAANF